jgi:cytochrome c-type biogenesis protein CcsB
MEKMSLYAFTAALIALVPAAALYLLHLVARLRVGARRLATTGGGTLATGVVVGDSGRSYGQLGSFATLLGWLALAFLLLWMVTRTIATHHAPYGNQYEFGTSFATGMLAVYLVSERFFGEKRIGAVVVPIALGMLLYVNSLPSAVVPLVPALQSPVLTVHVAMAIVSYGAATTAFGAAVLYLINYDAARPEGRLTWLPAPATTDEIGYRAATVALPAQAMLLLLGAYWGNIAWGRWWGFDPKETAALTTFLVFAAYMHLRTLRGWRGRRSASLLVLAFAATLFTYFGNLFLGGLHAYSGL